MLKYQRGVTVSGLLFWGIVLILVAVLAMKVAPSVIEYGKILKDSKAVVAQVGQGASVADVKRAFARYAEIDHLEFTADQLDISKEGNQIVISFAYEKRIHLFHNVSLLIDYQGSTSGQ